MIQLQSYSSKVPSNWMLLSFQDTHIGIPQEDVETILIAADLINDKSSHGSPSFKLHNEHWPTYNLNSSFYPKAVDERSFCVVLKNDDKFIGLMCENTEMVSAESGVLLQPLPVSIKKRISPFEYVAVHKDSVVSIGPGVKIIEYLKKVSQLMQKTGGSNGTN